MCYICVLYERCLSAMFNCLNFVFPAIKTEQNLRSLTWKLKTQHSIFWWNSNPETCLFDSAVHLLSSHNSNINTSISTSIFIMTSRYQNRCLGLFLQKKRKKRKRKFKYLEKNIKNSVDKRDFSTITLH